MIAQLALTLEFLEVAGYQWFSPEGKALSHGTVNEIDPFIATAWDISEDDSTEGFKVYSFVAVWNDAKIPKVVAKMKISRRFPHGVIRSAVKFRMARSRLKALQVALLGV
jgi:hypothetical protein